MSTITITTTAGLTIEQAFYDPKEALDWRASWVETLEEAGQEIAQIHHRFHI
jgi:hypothetical protein